MQRPVGKPDAAPQRASSDAQRGPSASAPDTPPATGTPARPSPAAAQVCRPPNTTHSPLAHIRARSAQQPISAIPSSVGIANRSVPAQPPNQRSGSISNPQVHTQAKHTEIRWSSKHRPSLAVDARLRSPHGTSWPIRRLPLINRQQTQSGPQLAGMHDRTHAQPQGQRRARPASHCLSRSHLSASERQTVNFQRQLSRHSQPRARPPR